MDGLQPRRWQRVRWSCAQAQSTGGMRPDAGENSQISCSTIVRAARAAGSHPHLASVLLQGRKSANIRVSFGVIRGIPAEMEAIMPAQGRMHFYLNWAKER